MLHIKDRIESLKEVSSFHPINYSKTMNKNQSELKGVAMNTTRYVCQNFLKLSPFLLSMCTNYSKCITSYKTFLIKNFVELLLRIIADDKSYTIRSTLSTNKI